MLAKLKTPVFIDNLTVEVEDAHILKFRYCCVVKMVKFVVKQKKRSANLKVHFAGKDSMIFHMECILWNVPRVMTPSL